MLSKMMLSGSNVLMLDEPTNHLDLESITALNNGLISFKGSMIFSSHDHQFIQTIANRIIELTPKGTVDKQMSYDEYLENGNCKNKSLKCTNNTFMKAHPYWMCFFVPYSFCLHLFHTFNVLKA